MAAARPRRQAAFSCLLFVFAPAIAVAAGVFVATTAACGGDDEDTSGNSDSGGKKQQQSTKSSCGNSDGNGDNDSNDNDDENEGNGVVDGSAVWAVAQYIPNRNCLLFN